MNNRNNIIKSGILFTATAIVLIIAAVAWFSSGNLTDVQGVSATVDSGDYTSAFYESPDTDKDGALDGPIDDPDIWQLVSGPALDIVPIVPGEKHFYRIEIRINKPVDLSLIFSEIAVSIPDGASFTKSDMLGRVNVFTEIRDEDGDAVTGTTFDDDMLAFLDNDPDLTMKAVYDEMDMTAYVGTTINIYYFVGIDGSTVDKADDFLQETGFRIGVIDFSVS